MKMPADSSKKKLGALSMPDKRGSDKALEMDLSMPAEDASDSQEDDKASDDDQLMDGADNMVKDPDSMGSMDHISDDELLAEAKKRGLDKKLEEDSESPADESQENDDDSQGGYSLRA